jgi:uncharacterized protein
MPSKLNIAIPAAKGDTIYLDLHVPSGPGPFPIAAFCHGFKGFKDWGYFPFLYKAFNPAGIAIATFNFSLNGVGKGSSTEFTQLDNFARNTVSIELQEIKMVIDWVSANADEFNLNQNDVSLVGHSRGAAEAIVYSTGDKRIKRTIAWAPISEFGLMFRDTDLKKWEREGKILIPNARTKQEMPLNYSYWQDLKDHEQGFDIVRAASVLEKPLLLLHGANDTSVTAENSGKIYEKCTHAIYLPIQNADHTFNAGHPFEETASFPKALVDALENTIEFIID